MCVLYGGSFLLSLIHYRICRKRAWGASIGLSVLWMIFYVVAVAVTADILTSLPSINHTISNDIMKALFIAPYICAILLYFKSRYA